MTAPAFSTPVIAPDEPIIIEPKEAVAIAFLAALGWRIHPDGKIVTLILKALKDTGWRLVRAD